MWGSDGVIGAGKSFTTNDDLVLGLIGALDDAVGGLGLERKSVLRQTACCSTHSVGTNAVVERRGAKVAVVCTRGHRDVLSMMRAAGRVTGSRPNGSSTSPTPKSRRRSSALADLRDQRADLADGSVFIELDEEAAEAIAADVVEAGRLHCSHVSLGAEQRAQRAAVRTPRRQTRTDSDLAVA